MLGSCQKGVQLLCRLPAALLKVKQVSVGDFSESRPWACDRQLPTPTYGHVAHVPVPKEARSRPSPPALIVWRREAPLRVATANSHSGGFCRPGCLSSPFRGDEWPVCGPGVTVSQTVNCTGSQHTLADSCPTEMPLVVQIVLKF